MDTVKTYKHGHNIAITVDSKFTIPPGKIYYIYVEDNGTISLIPKVDDYFANAKENEFIDDEDDLV
ncbi:AbrB family transcriptional regulator [Staphylococcus microti]|uniref:AbrB family transcriptional regulator n=1 Tax=Staphylococcus microti TaxID=569857 RepID=A0A0D6XSH8_9STAP|nr:hypothetical protein [Staphylococcus microti]KIX90793.1 AbrB family transcriptional regulator [Staphylococcus microti]PNZ82185.1 AbrB family transcriptional regulator [Staphylococcus microti]SUM57453.1 Uncharacterised protein [Staphylococcus microti]